MCSKSCSAKSFHHKSHGVILSFTLRIVAESFPDGHGDDLPGENSLAHINANLATSDQELFERLRFVMPANITKIITPGIRYPINSAIPRAFNGGKNEPGFSAV